MNFITNNGKINIEKLIEIKDYCSSLEENKSDLKINIVSKIHQLKIYLDFLQAEIDNIADVVYRNHVDILNIGKCADTLWFINEIFEFDAAGNYKVKSFGELLRGNPHGKYLEDYRKLVDIIKFNYLMKNEIFQEEQITAFNNNDFGVEEYCLVNNIDKKIWFSPSLILF